MSSLMRPATAVNVVCAAILVLTAVVPLTADGASSNPTVTVVNTTANPVPVSGSITVGNSVVPVEVSNAEPIPVSVAQSAVKDPEGTRAIFTKYIVVAMGGGSGWCNSQDPLSVPSGKRLVIQYVAIQAILFDGVKINSISMRESGSSGFSMISIPAFNFSISGTVSNSVGGGQAMHFYSDTALEACAISAAPTNGSVTVVVSGYYVDKS